MGKRIISLQEAQSITNDDYLVIDNQSGGTKKVSAGFINDIVSDVQVDGTSVVDGGVAEIDLSGKQNTLTAGSNIQIAQDGTISATDTTYTAGTNVQIDNGVISATDTTYTAGTNVQINNNVISATDTTYTAGTNVQINNGVISATDTTYSAFGGATAGADGSSGLVPQPLIADKDKFLKGDGTWDIIQPGASALDDLTNVDITSPTNGQVLKYDSTNQEWVNANESGGGGASAVADLTDVNLTSLANGQILKYDSTSQKWINSDESGGGNLSYETVFSGSKSTSAWNSPLVFNEFDVTACDIIRITAAHDSYSYTWLIDTSLIPLTGGNKLHIYGEVYCDRDDTELQMYVSTGHALEVSKIESVISGGGGSSVIPNPTGTPTDTLDTVSIDGTIYEIVGGGGSTGGILKGLDYANAVTLTLPDYTGYDYTPTGYGVLMATSYGGVGCIGITSQNEDVKYLSFRDDTWTTSWIPVTKDEVYHLNRGSSSTDFPSGSWFKFIPWLCEDGGGSSAEEMSLVDYNELTTEEKNDGTIRFIPESNIGYSLDIDFTNSTAIKESGMSGTTVNNNSVQIVWDTVDTYCGLTIYPIVKIDVTNYDFISYDFTSTNSYDSLNPGSKNPVRDLGVGLRPTAPSTMTLAPNMDYTVWNRYEITDVGTTFTDERIDVSNLTGEYYLIIACAGWNAVVSNIVIGTEGGSPSQIKYMDKTYGIGSDGSGYTEEVIYSATPTTAAPSTLTLTKPYTDFDILIFNLYRSADGVMNKYDRVVLTSKLSLNDRIQLITYNEYVSYDITTTTSFTLINENRMYIGSVVGLKFGEGSGSGGSSEITYSTTEHQVGTWIDGSDVYEKSFEVQITASDLIIIEQDASYIDALLSFEGSCKSSAGLMAGSGMPVSTGWGFAVHRNASNQLILYGDPTAVSNGTAYVTIRYTKVAAS